MTMRVILARTALLLALWGVLTGAAADSWFVGGVTVALALGTSVRLQPRAAARLSFSGLLAFGAFFLAKSIAGGIQVAAMALRPRMDLRPAVVELRLRLPRERERIFAAGALNLLPGTISVALEGTRLQLHVLDSRMPTERGVRALEARVAAMFGAQLP